MPVEIKSVVRTAGGLLVKFTHNSEEIGLPMTASLFLPTNALSLNEALADSENKYPVLMYLSGLTCTDDNVCQKGGAFSQCMSSGLALLCPDTSPRGANCPGEDDSWDLGTGAGFYVDATAEPWSTHYRMFSYVTEELPALLRGAFPVCDTGRMGVTGHSMGGHGALICALRRPDLFRSVSAFSPICNPVACPWGRKAFAAYLGSAEAGAGHDATALLAKMAPGEPLFDDILVDVGGADSFLAAGQLLPEALERAALQAGQPLTMRTQPGYDHSYYFVSTFLPEHIRWHAKRL